MYDEFTGVGQLGLSYFLGWCHRLHDMWGVRLDGVALINLIMCIGFSVDFRYNNLQNYLFLLHQTTVLLHKIHLLSPSYE